MLLLFIICMFVVFLGLFCGLAIGLMAEEELVPGKKYLVLLRTVILFVSLIIFVCSMLIKGLFAPALAIIIMTLLFCLNKERFTNYYYLIAVMLCFGWVYDFFLILAPIAFLYGFPVGGLHVFEQKNKRLFEQITSLLAKHAGFLIIMVFAFIIGVI